jgi:hypothetical protein
MLGMAGYTAPSSDRGLTRRSVAGLALGALTSVALILGACGGGGDDIVVATTTPTPTPTATPTPSPTPTPAPTEPVPAEEIPLGESMGYVNPSSLGFPEPPPSARQTPVVNTSGAVRMVSTALGLDHYIEDLGVSNGQMESPDEDGNHSVGWYAPSSSYKFGTPGTFGNSVFSAHETWGHMQGPFYQVHQARIGEDIFLHMADGEIRRYQVARIDRYPVGEMPMREVLWPSDRPEYEEWLTLYTCGGEIVYGPNGYGDYLERDVLVAKYVGSVDAQEPPIASTGSASAASTLR